MQDSVFDRFNARVQLVGIKKKQSKQDREDNEMILRRLNKFQSLGDLYDKVTLSESAKELCEQG